MSATRTTDPLHAGQDALRRGAWEEGREHFRAALAAAEEPEALEGLGWASWWLDDAATVFDARERALRLYNERGDPRGAARVAMWLALDYIDFRGEQAVADGLLRRARRLLDGVPPGAEHGWLACLEGHEALMLRKDAQAARRLGADASALARQVGPPDVEILGLALEGLALVTEGRVDEGMRRLDEATTAALSGEISDPNAICIACCYLIHACERVRDYSRAAQWCERVRDLATRWRSNQHFSVCRTQYAGVLMCRGDWPGAEAELTAAADEFAAIRPALAASAAVRLGELRRRQGRWDEAAALFHRVEHKPLAQLGLAELGLDSGDATTAANYAERYLRNFPPEARTERAAGLEILARARVALADDAAARVAVEELDAIAATISTPPLRASAAYGAGLLSFAAGDFSAARRHFEDAVDMYEHGGLPFEGARARIELARTLVALGQPVPARQQADAARRALETLGATRLVELADALAQDARRPADARLTAREVEVLRLVSRGLSDKEVAANLFLSEHTVHRHVANILTKLGVRTRASAVATASQQRLL